MCALKQLGRKEEKKRKKKRKVVRILPSETVSLIGAEDEEGSFLRSVHATSWNSKNLVPKKSTYRVHAAL